MGRIFFRIARENDGKLLRGVNFPVKEFIQIEIESENHTPVLRASMSVDQFIVAMMTTSSSPITLEHYFEGVKPLREKVENPKNVKERMSERLEGFEGDTNERLDEIMRRVEAVVDGQKKPNKKYMEELLKEIEIYASHQKSNRDFVLKQVEEEAQEIGQSLFSQVAAVLSQSDIDPTRILIAGQGSPKQLTNNDDSPSGFYVQPPPVVKADIPPTPIEDMTPRQLAKEIDARLKQWERTELNLKKEGKYNNIHLYMASSHYTSRGVYVSYVSYQSTSFLTTEEARKYLMALRKGDLRRHFEVFHDEESKS